MSAWTPPNRTQLRHKQCFGYSQYSQIDCARDAFIDKSATLPEVGALKESES